MIVYHGQLHLKKLAHNASEPHFMKRKKKEELCMACKTMIHASLGHNLLLISFSSGGFAQTDAGIDTSTSEVVNKSSS